MSSRTAPRNLRASDADRDRVMAMLAEAMADGRLSADEHAERVSRAVSARTLGELAGLTADLAEPAAQPLRLDGGRVITGLLGTETRDGRWVVPETVTVSAIFGEAVVDFRSALLQSRHVVLYATAIGGRVRLIVPAGVTVVMSGTVLVGRKRGGTALALPADPDMPVIEVRAFVVGGEVVARTPRRSFLPRWRRRELRQRSLG
jgi:Domain of unknown function (DUF1707)/Cell wall-active antibiotics response 4TMS YvqF